MSHAKDNSAPAADFYVRSFEYARIVTDVTVTDEGVYQKDEVPETYGGAQLDLQVVNAVFMIDARARMQILEFEVPSPMDKERKKGGPIHRDGKEYREATGSSTVIVKQTTVLNENLDDARKQLGAAAFAAFQEALAGSNQPPT